MSENFNWSDDAVAELRRLWLTHSGAGCAYALTQMFGGYLTRNAVIGKAHRLGLGSGRAARLEGPSAEARPRRQANNQNNAGWRIARRSAEVARAAAPVLAPKPQADFDNVIPFGQRRTLLELRSGECRWPVGDPRRPGFFFCGGPACEGRSYCAHHTRIAYELPAFRQEARAPRASTRTGVWQ